MLDSAGGERWECIFLADYNLTVGVRNVAFDSAVVDHVSKDALCLIQVHIFHTHPLQGTQEQGDVDLVGATYQESAEEKSDSWLINKKASFFVHLSWRKKGLAQKIFTARGSKCNLLIDVRKEWKMKLKYE